MKRKLLFLNVLLAGLLILGAAELYRQVLDANARYDRLEAFSDPRQPPEFPSPSDPMRTRATDFMPIVDRLLFSEDRNAVVVVETVESVVAQRPGLPMLAGLIDFGDGPSALMTARSDEPASWISVGDKIGDFVFEGVDGDDVTLSWNEEQFTVTQDELNAAPPPVQTASTGRGRGGPRGGRPNPAATASTNLAGAGPQSLLGPEIGDGRRAVVRGDDSPDGTEKEGYVKNSRSTPFGKASWWQKKEE